MNSITFGSNGAVLDVSELGLLEDPFPSLSRPVAPRRISKASLRRRRLAKRNAVLLALAADRTGTGRAASLS